MTLQLPLRNDLPNRTIHRRYLYIRQRQPD